MVAGEGNKRLFRNLGVDFIVDGGQSMNPSTEDLMRAIDKARAPSVIILPNNSNVIMTAEQTTALSDRDIQVVPSRSLQAGLSAAVAYERRNDGGTNARDMRAALEAVVTGEITRAVRDSLVDGVQVEPVTSSAWSRTGGVGPSRPAHGGAVGPLPAARGETGAAHGAGG